MALLLGACGKKDAPDPYVAMSVSEAEASIASLNGRTVTVRGWLADPCQDLSCAIFPAPVKPGQRWPKGAHLSIAAETLVEPMLVEYQGKEVILRGVLSSQCRANRALCTDRAPDITPVSMKALSAIKEN